MFEEEIQTQNCNIYNINEVIKHTLKYLFSITEQTSCPQRKIKSQDTV